MTNANPNLVKVEYSSIWEEGIVTTRADLDLATGEVLNIESSCKGDDYEHLIRDEIGDHGENVCATVHPNDDGTYSINTDDLKIFRDFYQPAKAHDESLTTGLLLPLSGEAYKAFLDVAFKTPGVTVEQIRTAITTMESKACDLLVGMAENEQDKTRSLLEIFLVPVGEPFTTLDFVYSAEQGGLMHKSGDDYRPENLSLELYLPTIILEEAPAVANDGPGL